MDSSILAISEQPQWFAIRTRQDFRAEEILGALCDEVFFPKETVKTVGKKKRLRAAIPHVLFIRTSHQRALDLEKESRLGVNTMVPFWIYRYPKDNRIQVIPDAAINLLRMLTTEGDDRCTIFNKTNFKPMDHVRVTEGIYKGYEGYVTRVKKNKHVVVRIEGVCLVLLPFIHPDLLEKLD